MHMDQVINVAIIQNEIAFLPSIDQKRDNQKAGVVSFVIKCQLHRIRNFELFQLFFFFGVSANFSVKQVSEP